MLVEVVKFNPIMTKVMPVQTFFAVGFALLNLHLLFTFPAEMLSVLKQFHGFVSSVSLYLNGAMLLMVFYLICLYMFIQV